MFKKLLTALAVSATLLLPIVAQATILFPTGGGTGSSTLTGILIGNGVSPVNTLTIGTGLTLTGTTLTSTGGGSSTFGTTSIFATTPLQWNTTTATLSILQAGTSQNGYLTSTDWNTFNNKDSFAYPFPANATTSALTLGGLTLSNLAGGGTLCVHVNNSGVFSTTASDCGSGSGGVTGVTATNPLFSSGGTSPNITTLFSTTTTFGLGNNGFLVLGPTGIPFSAASSTLNLPNTALQNSSVTVNGTAIALGASGTVTANTPNAVTFNSSGSGGASPQVFNGSSAETISYNTIGAQVAGTYDAVITATTPIIRSINNLIFVGLATTSQPASSNILTSNGAAGVYGTATSTLTPSSPLTGSFTQIGSGGSIGCQIASGSQAGCLASADFTTFNNKQAAGNYITALTGDVTATGPNSVAATLATVNSNVGTFTYPSVTVNGKGLITAISNGTAPTTYTGTFPIAVTGSVISSLFSTTSNSGVAQGNLYVGSGGIFQSSATGTISNGTGISVTAGQSVIGSGLTITNTGVTSNVAGTGISVSGATGAVTITNSGVTSLGNGTGTTCSGTAPGTCNVNTTQNITTLSNLTVAGFVQTTSGGVLSSAALTSGQVTTALGFTPLSAALTSVGDGLATSTGPVIGLATSTASFNGLTVADAITNVGSTFTITPLWSGTLNNAGLTNSSVTVNTGTGLSGGGAVSLGGTALSLANTGVISNSCSSGISCSGTNPSAFTNTGVTSIVAGTNVTISGATGAVTINATGSGSSFAFPWTPTNNFGINTNATSTAISFFQGIFASSTSVIASTTFAINGNVGISTSSPSAQLTVASKTSADQTPAFVIDGATGSFNADMQLNRGSNTGTEEANIDFATAGTVNYQLGIQNNSTSDFELWDGSNDPVLTVKNGTNNIGFGSSTPFGDFAINADFGDVLPGNLIFNVASSSATATTSVFQINNIGQVVLPLITGTQCLHTISGVVSGTGSDCGAGGSSFAYPFTPSTDNGIKTSATSTPIQGTNPGLGLDVSATSWYGIGGQLLAYASTTNNSVVFGLQAGGQPATTSNSSNLGETAIGVGALQSLSNGIRNTAIGNFAGNALTTGTQNVAVGGSALTTAVSGGSNAAFGYGALQQYTGSSNSAFGFQALTQNSNGAFNSAFGAGSLSAITTGTQNVAVGYHSFTTANTSSNNNTAIGYLTGPQGTGYAAQQNTIVGSQAGASLIAGGNDNTLIGTYSGANMTSGYGNTLIGLTFNPTSITTGHNNINLGGEVFNVNVAGSNQLNIGNLIYGTIPATTTVFQLPTTGSLGIGTSSPFAKFAIQSNNGDTAATLFAIGSSTQTATSTLFSIGNTGAASIFTPTNITNAFGVFNAAGSNVFNIDTTATNPFLGVGTTTPWATASIVGDGTDPVFAVSTSTSNNVLPNFEIDQNGHVVTSGPKPTCTTSCTFGQGNDNAFRVTSGTAVTSEVVTFAKSWGTNAPICQATEGNNTAVPILVAASSTPTTVTLTNAALTTRDIDVICEGIQ